MYMFCTFIRISLWSVLIFAEPHKTTNTAQSLCWENDCLFICDIHFQLWIYLPSCPLHTWGRISFSLMTVVHLEQAKKLKVWLWSVHRKIYRHIWLENQALDTLNYPGFTRWPLRTCQIILEETLTGFFQLYPWTGINVKQNIPVQKFILCYRFARSTILGRTWYQTWHMHLNAAGTPVNRHSTAYRHTSAMLRHMSIATHMVEKWKEVFLATGVVSSNL